MAAASLLRSRTKQSAPPAPPTKLPPSSHQAPEALWSCRVLATLIWTAIRGAQAKEKVLASIKVLKNERTIPPRIREIVSGSYHEKAPPEIRGTGYVANSLEAALWAFFHAEDFRHGALLAVNLGDDADTTGAVYGQIAGAFFKNLPEVWLAKLAWRQQITALADRLFSASQGRTGLLKSEAL